MKRKAKAVMPQPDLRQRAESSLWRLPKETVHLSTADLERLLHELREYWKTVRSPHYLFPGRTFDVPLSGTTIQKTCKAAVLKAGIRKRVTPHTLRHSYATGLYYGVSFETPDLRPEANRVLEAGVDLLTIARLLGHRSFSTTLVYLHVRRPHLASTPSPIDWLPVRQLPRWEQAETQPTDNNENHNG